MFEQGIFSFTKVRIPAVSLRKKKYSIDFCYIKRIGYESISYWVKLF